MKYLEKSYRIQFSCLACLLLFSNCFTKNDSHYNFWQKNSTLQNSIKSSTNKEVYISALSGVLSKEKEKELKQNTEGFFYLTLSARFQNDVWNIDWYPAQYRNEEYSNEVTFQPVLWNKTEIYIVNRKILFNFFGFLPRDFFQWLNQFAQLTVNHENLLRHRNTNAGYSFLCETFSCQTIEEPDSILLEFELNKKTEKKFPGFYKRIGNRLDKSILDIKIWDSNFPEDKILISNIGKIIQIRFPVKPRKKIFQNPKTIEILTNIQIKSFGVTFTIEDLLYKFKMQSKANQDILEGKFQSYASTTLNGKFLYFIPFGVIDLFIPGNLEEYLSNFMKLLVYGSQGNGGAHFKATYTKKSKEQFNVIEAYSEILRNRFSLFGNESNAIEPPQIDFYLNWEKSMLEDLKTIN